MNGLPAEVVSAAQALGLMDSDGNLQPTWFEAPLDHLRTLLSDPTQQAAVLELLEAIAPSVSQDGESWHPLLPSSLPGNLYLTTRSDDSGRLVVGLSAAIGGGATPAASLRLHLPIVSASRASLDPIAGTSDGPLVVEARLELDWSAPLVLRALRATASLSPFASGGPGAALTLTLEGIDLDGNGARDVVLDPEHLTHQAAEVVLALLRNRLASIGGAAAHLLPLLGLGGDQAARIPALPIADLADAGGALRGWARRLVDDTAGTAPVLPWLGHLAGLLGSSDGAAINPTDPAGWRVRLLALDATDGGLYVTVARRRAADSSGDELEIGASLAASLATGGVTFRLEAAATLAAISLKGPGTRMLPSISITVGAEGASGTSLVSTGPLVVGAVRAGARWDGQSLAPLIELDRVTAYGASYDRLDLTAADSVAATAASTVVNLVVSTLGSGAGRSLAALATLVPPASQPSWSHLADVGQLVVDPTGAIARAHYAALSDGSWSALFSELCSLVGITATSTGAGTEDDPWRASLISAGPLQVELAAWNATAGSDTTQRLRLGLRASASAGPWSASWLAELLDFNLPVSGSASVSFLAGQHAAATLAVPAVATSGGVGISADSAGAHFDWTRSTPFTATASLTNLTVTVGATTIPLGTLSYPSSSGLSGLWSAARGLVGRAAFGWAGMEGLALAGLLGITGALDGLASDSPLIGDGATSLIAHPGTALREWLQRVVIASSSDGAPFLPRLLRWLRALLARRLPEGPDEPLSDGPLSGSGSYELPWTLPFDESASVEGLVWLEPAGPPASWTSDWNARLSAASDFYDLLSVLAEAAPLVASVRDGLQATALANAAEALDALAGSFAGSDGIVPVESQQPPSWTAVSIGSAHASQPADDAAITEILSRIGPAPRKVLMLGPAFSDHQVWQPLLARAGVSSGNFDLRVPGVDPGSVDLQATPAGDFYTADLADDGANNLTSLVAQIGRIVDRIGELDGGVTPTPVTLVAHSTAGVAARVYASAHAARTKMLITLGTPHSGAPLTPLSEADVASAVRLLSRLFPSGLGVPVFDDALRFLGQALDGCHPPASPGELPTAAPFPLADFAGAGGADAPGVPAVALGSALGDGLFDAVKSASVALVAAASPPAPTHLAFGVRARLPLDGSGGGVDVDLALRAELFRAALDDGAPELAARPLSLDATLTDPSGWLVGSAGQTVDGEDARVRWARLGADLSIGSDGSLQIQPRASLSDGADASPLAARVELDDAQLPALLGQAMARLGQPAGSTGDILQQALAALGLAATRDDGTAALAADALAAMEADPLSYFTSRMAAALSVAAPLWGFAASDGGWAAPLGASGLELALASGPGSLVLRTTNDLAVGDSLSLAFAAKLDFPTLAPQLDVTLRLGDAKLQLDGASRTLSLDAAPWTAAPLSLWPPPGDAALISALERAVPLLALSAAVSGVVEAAFGSSISVAPIASLLVDPSRPFRRADGGPDASTFSHLLDAVSRALGGTSAPVQLPLGLELAISGTDTVVLSLTSASPIGGVLDVDLKLAVEKDWRITPSGNLGVTLALDPAGTWPSVSLRFGVDPSGVSLSLAPSGIPPIELLPHFAGLGALAQGLESLLPALLDDLVSALSTPTRSALLAAVLEVASALGLWDASGGFRAHTDALRDLGDGGFFARFSGSRSSVAGNLAQLFSVAPLASLLPSGASVAAADERVVLSYAPGAPLGGVISLALGWDGAGPSLQLSTDGLALGGLALLDVQAGYSSGAPAASVALTVDLSTLVAPGLAPSLKAEAGAAGFSLVLLPLGDGAPAPMTVQLLPSPAIHLESGAPLQIVWSWLLPLAVRLAQDAFAGRFDAALWSGGPSANDVLTGSKLIGASPPTSVSEIVSGAIAALCRGGVTLPSTSLALSFVDEDIRLGIRLSGSIPLSLGSLVAQILFGDAGGVIHDSDRGLTLFLFDTSGSFAPELQLIGCGLGLSGSDEEALVDNRYFRLGSVDAFLFLDLSLAGGGLDASDFGAGVALEGLGLPMGLASSGSGNPVAAGLLQSSGGGDSHPVNPPIALAVIYRDELQVLLQGDERPVFVGVHASFGPLYIDQIGLAGVHDEDGGDGIQILVDGSIHVAGLTIGLDDLGLKIPFAHALSPDHWGLDLRGLSVGYSSSGVMIAGGLAKSGGATLEYDGMLTVDLAGRGFTAVGSYARLSDASGDFTSLFVFASLSAPLGGPPFLFVTGLGAGAGYNRELIPPTDIRDVPSFLLVTAIDDDHLANDPMQALAQMGSAMPPKRGSFWLAAGLRFTTFGLVHSVAVVYAEIDRSLEIGLLGTSRMELPSGDEALVNIELALKARYSTADQTLSIRAQLTDNSWLLSRDCQLTGGFAFFIWFGQGQFVLTLGGYHPAFQKPAQFPDVPRLGYHWSVSDAIVVKGESYFALTNSCVMAGCSTDTSYHLGPVRVWFSASADFLIGWDPFEYHIAVDISVGASFTLEICFFGCVDIDVSVSLGARLKIDGPPLRGEVTVDLDIASVTVAFGADHTDSPPFLDFESQFAAKYLVAGDPENNWVAVHALGGLTPPDPPGAQPAAGSGSQPWKLQSEFALGTETRMPASSYMHFLGASTPAPAPGASKIDLAAIGPHASNAQSTHKITITDSTGATVAPPPGSMRVELVNALVPEAPWRYVDGSARRASANTLNVLGGLRVIAQAALENQSADIPYSTLVTDDERAAQPLPFAALDASVLGQLQALGVSAEALALPVTASGAQLIVAAGKLLAGSGAFADNRSQLGARPLGLSPLQSSALTRRSAAPLVAPLAAPLTMKPVGLAMPPAVVLPPKDAPEALATPRLRSSLRARPTSSATHALHAQTTVAKVATPQDLRRHPPRPAVVAGARLVVLPAAIGAPRTVTAQGGASLRSRELGGSLGAVHAAQIARAESDLLQKGVTIAAGPTHVWDLPPPKAGTSWKLHVNGDALRALFCDSAGRVLDDRELTASESTQLIVPSGSATIVLQCLGAARLQVVPGLGSVSSAFGAVGWQSGNLLPLVAETVLLGRGALALLGRPHLSERSRQATSQAMVSAGEVLGRQRLIETWLPIKTRVVLLLLDQIDPSAAEDGDLALATEGGRLSTPPLRVVGGRRRALLYDVKSRERGAQHLGVTAGSLRGWRLAGCVGLGGHAVEWATRFAGDLPLQLVADGPLTPSGHAIVRLEESA